MPRASADLPPGALLFNQEVLLCTLSPPYAKLLLKKFGCPRS
ncbi:hypothetical protein HMPREF1986_00494 [Oribacterium sp. oral taxon 078 str. F0263]|nr:hypothetical protein HMPREF1986_00494 [Oribacterium sp. oral taxon 078 str. F0263]